LKSQQIDLACSGPFVSTECRKEGIQLGELLASCAKFGEVDTCELIQSLALGLDGQQPLLIVLPVHVDERTAKFLELSDGR
jgi:hypothetical protein